MAKTKIKSNIALSDSGFIFIPSSGDSYSANPIGLQILNLLKQNKNEKEIKAAILADYQVDAATFEKDYYDFVNQLKQNNMIENEK